ncbi:MAG: hypothetical protein ACHQJX_01430 [Candidatus Acidiferrales bacterium]|jgi:hypothetical protein
MKSTQHVRQIATLCAAFALLWPGMARAKAKRDINRQLQLAIAKVRKAKTSDAEYDTAERLVALTYERDCSDVTDETIRSMVSLLNMQDDVVRMWVAAALGDIGPRAKIAAPKLLSILAEVECKDLDFSSEATIPIALKKMGVTPPPRNCRPAN